MEDKVVKQNETITVGFRFITKKVILLRRLFSITETTNELWEYEGMLFTTTELYQEYIKQIKG